MNRWDSQPKDITLSLADGSSSNHTLMGCRDRTRDSIHGSERWSKGPSNQVSLFKICRFAPESKTQRDTRTRPGMACDQIPAIIRISEPER